MQAAVDAAHKSRIYSSKQLLLKVNEDNIQSNERYEKEEENVTTFSTEIEKIQDEIYQLELILNEKKHALEDAKNMLDVIVDRVNANYDCRQGLLIRLLVITYNLFIITTNKI